MARHLLTGVSWSQPYYGGDRVIITISREFGSGGRELGKRLAEELGIPCYDAEIIDHIAAENGFDKNYVAHFSEQSLTPFYMSTIGRRFATGLDAHTQQVMQISAAQWKIVENFAKQGDCVIVGRASDIILEKYDTLDIFVYASTESKIERCQKRAKEGEHWTAGQIKKKMKEIDKGRARYRAAFSDTKWGAKENYDLCVNTTGREIKSLIPALAQYARAFFNSGKLV